MSIIRPDDPIRLLASTPVAAIHPDASLNDLAAGLAADHVGVLAVMNDDQLVGIVSERDAVRVLAADADPADVWAADVMAAEPVLVDAEAPIVEAAELMLDEGVRHLPVMSEGRTVGVVSVRDVLRVFTDEWRRSEEGQT